ncbi:hypothetical protein BDV19DRAFT_315066 [Aspergillus venezuelensis]
MTGEGMGAVGDTKVLKSRVAEISFALSSHPVPSPSDNRHPRPPVLSYFASDGRRDFILHLPSIDNPVSRSFTFALHNLTFSTRLLSRYLRHPSALALSMVIRIATRITAPGPRAYLETRQSYSTRRPPSHYDSSQSHFNRTRGLQGMSCLYRTDTAFETRHQQDFVCPVNPHSLASFERLREPSLGIFLLCYHSGATRVGFH